MTGVQTCALPISHVGTEHDAGVNGVHGGPSGVHGVERRIALGERDRAVVRDNDRLAAHQVAGLGNVLIGMHDEDHALLELHLALIVQVSGAIGGDAEAVAAHARAATLSVLGMPIRRTTSAGKVSSITPRT